MDPVTHSLIGLGVASFSGNPLSFTNPIYIGSLLGSLAPDFDFILQAKGDVFYLRHHRGVSHSLPGSVMLAGALSWLLTFIFPGTGYWSLFIWTWLGTLSHCLIDVFNSYGSELLWPFYRKKVSCNLLNIFDPYLFILLSILLYAGGKHPIIRNLSLLSGLAYLVFRFGIRWRIRKIFNGKWGTQPKRILIMPALKGSWNWDVFIEEGKRFIIGQVSSFSLTFKLRQKLWKQQNSLIKIALESKLGKLFSEFTPLFHVSHQRIEKGHLVQFFDLRFHFKQAFLHTGTAIFNEENVLVEEIFSPYLGKRKVKLVG